MPDPNRKLAASLDVLRSLQGTEGRRVFRSEEFTRTHRERLARHGFLAPVMKGWWLVADPAAGPGDTTAWFASFWEFCARYCRDRFGDEWHLSPVNSLLLHAETPEAPRQVVIHAPAGANNALRLPFGASLYDYASAMPESGRRALIVREGLNLLTPAEALCQAPPDFFTRHAIAAQVALASIPDVSDVLATLLARGSSVVAGRLAGAFRRVGRPDVADEILRALRRADYQVRESDPFDPTEPLAGIRPRTPPVAARLEGLWQTMRTQVLRAFPPEPGPVSDPAAYLRSVDDLYQTDAYHSLSIEGYQVSHDLVERIRRGDWDPEQCDRDEAGRDALAARGYYQAFERVKEALREILRGATAAAVVRPAHRAWYGELFQPAVAAGLLAPQDLAGYRNRPVFIQGSHHVPPRVEVVRDAMSALFDLLEQEDNAAVRAVLGHWMFGYIHPYPDGNGRIVRFLMNAMLASGGYPWTVIRMDDRADYMAALEQASVDQDIAPFAGFIAECMGAMGGAGRLKGSVG
jgi:fido (protein-threonine AMPylation protein)